MNIADQQEIITLWPQGVPGSVDLIQQEQETFAPPPISFRTVRNVTQPTLTVFLPLFIALANDDELAVEPCLALYRAWRTASHPVELHIYAQGGHGFGMRKQGLPADGWIDCFSEWLQVRGYIHST